MILQALTKYYEILVENGKIAAAGWDPVRVSYAINIDSEGRFHGIQSLLVKGLKGKKEGMIPCVQNVPRHATRSGKMPPPYFLCDNARYLLGAWSEIGKEEDNKKNKEKANEYFQNAARYHKEILKDCDNPVAKGISLFFDTWNFETQREQITIPIEDIISAPNLVFRFWDTGEYVLQNEQIRERWNEVYSDSSGEEIGQCLITGKNAPIARLHPLIKGVRGAQSSGAALVSFNASAFESYEKQQGMNAPVSEYAANAYGGALNYLLSEPKYNSMIGTDTVVYWSETGEDAYAEYFGDCLLDDNDDELKLVNTMKAISKGEVCYYQDCQMNPDTKFYILGLSPNAARLSVRFFYANTFGKIIRNVFAHYERLEIQKPVYEKREYPKVGNILYETVNRNAKDKTASPILVGNLFRAIIHDTKYPATIFSSIIIRIRSDHIINRNRAAMIKAYLLKNRPETREVVEDMELNETTRNVPYVLGRIFATLEYIQEAANPNLNTTIKDRYFNSVCATPAVVLPQLLKLSNNHLKVLSRENKGMGIFLEKQLGSLMELLDTSFPVHLTLEEQGIFILGYYHQTQKRYTKKEN